AIGSDFKIDASYLSPNVNLASRVQYATRQFGVHILISGMVHDLLSSEIQILMREIDCVELKGSKQAMHLWTYDMDLSLLQEQELDLSSLDDTKRKIYQKLMKERLYEYRKEVKFFHKQIYEGRISGKQVFLSKPLVLKVHSRFSKQFYDTWNTGYKLYIEGEWAKARPYFEETRDKILPGYFDNPSEVILGFLSAANDTKPSYWKGVRKLTSK
ncbi:adenylate and guanylate cyclase catalytic domain-containing protein, partial [Cardiosporidium cionae]